MADTFIHRREDAIAKLVATALAQKGQLIADIEGDTAKAHPSTIPVFSVPARNTNKMGSHPRIHIIRRGKNGEITFCGSLEEDYPFPEWANACELAYAVEYSEWAVICLMASDIARSHASRGDVTGGSRNEASVPVAVSA